MMADGQRPTELMNGANRKAMNTRYVLITPARNEDNFIKSTIQSVVAQTLRPLRWVVVSDGSTDDTDAIVRRYAAVHDWIEFVRMPERGERDFAGKVIAFNAGYNKVKDLDFDIIGNLDADITFEPDYFRFLTQKFEENLRLGVGGTPFREGGRQYDYRYTSIEHVSGACQLFRRTCFQDIGGYRPIKGGGIDLVAVTTARMLGWQTRTFTEKVCIHHRPMGTGMGKRLIAQIRFGREDYCLGTHPIWMIVRSIYQMRNRPFVLGGGLLMLGFLLGMLARVARPVSNEFIQFRRQEQMRRLKRFMRGVLFFKGVS
jgi:glycosyltransferase involved in cell wall biosynthesis